MPDHWTPPTPFARHSAARKLRVLLLLIMAVLQICMLGHCRTASARELKLVTGDNYVPLSGQELPQGGLASAIIGNVLDAMNIGHTLEFRPWRRGYEETQHGGYDGTFPYIYTETRSSDFIYSEPIIGVTSHIYVNRESRITTDRPSGLKGKATCLPLGYANTPRIETLVFSGEIRRITAKNMTTCAKMLEAGRIDFLEINDLLKDSAFRAAGIAHDGVRALNIMTKPVAHHLIVPRSKEWAATFIADFNRKLAEFRNSGALDKLVRDYMDKGTWPPEVKNSISIPGAIH